MENLHKQIVRELRRNQTKCEAILWEAVRNRKLNGKKFLRQHPIFYEINGKRKIFIADFYCSEKKLVIEIDGLIHLKQKDYDQIRTEIIETKGLKVIRFKNEEIEKDLEKVLNKIRDFLK